MRAIIHHPRAGLRLFCLISLTLALAFLLDSPGRFFVPGARGAAIVQNDFPVTTVSAASYVGPPLTVAKNSIVAAFGTQLATGIQSAPAQPLPTSLLGSSVTVNGTPAPLFYVSPNQINYLIPPDAAEGDADVVVTMTAGNGDQIISNGQIKIASYTPSIFTVNSTGSGPPAALTGRGDANNIFVFDQTPTFEPDPLHPGRFLPAPIDVGTADRPAFLVLYCTGAVNAPAGSVKAVLGGIEVPVTPVPAPGYTGLDQINMQIPGEFKGRGIVDLNIVSNGISSNTVSVNMAGNPASGMNISSFSVTDGAIAGQTVTINGAGFSTTPSLNLVRFGAAQGLVIAATANQLSVIVPFTAEAAQVMVQTPQGETRSSILFKVRTSISGLVQSTGSSTSPPAPLEGVTVRVVGRNISVRSNPLGVFVIPDLIPGVEQIEIDGGTTGVDPPFPRVALKAIVVPDRDTQFPQPISLQQIVGGSGGAGLAGNDQSPAVASRVFEALKQSKNAGTPDASQQLDNQSTQVPAKSVVISHRNVTLEIPLGVSVRFPDGKSSGQVQLTVLEKSRLPGVTLPAGVYSSNIAQITPLGAEFTPGASMSFPNPDQARLGPGAKVDLYRYDPRAGSFIKRGTATVTSDRARVVSDGRLVDLASFWKVGAPSGVTTVTGRVVVNGADTPIPGVQVSVNGRSDTSDQNGGFSIADVATAGVGAIQVEAVAPRLYGVSPRGVSTPVNAVAGGTTNVGKIMLSNVIQRGLALSPFTINFASNALSAKIEVTLTEPAPSDLTVTLSSEDTQVATVPAIAQIQAGRNTSSFNVTRVGPGVASITARATVSGTALESRAVVTAAQPAPRLAGVSPAIAPAGAKILITGAGFMPISNSNTVGFLRNNTLIAAINPSDNEIVFDAANQPALRVKVPDIAPGAAQIVVAAIDNLTGVISDQSAPINFTVARPDLNAPTLANVSPAQGKPRDLITINGGGFSAVANENLVTFRQGLIESQARVVKSSATQLSIEVPSFKVSKGRAKIIVRRALLTGGNGGSSNALDFTITEEPKQPPKPVLNAVVNATTGAASGRDGDKIVVTGSGFGGNFLNISNHLPVNNEPLVSMLLFYQNNALVNFALPESASGGAMLTATIPTGLSAAPTQTQITTITFDMESGLASEESNIFDKFSITVGSLRHDGEDEPNDAPELATEVSLQTIIDGKAAEGDPGDFTVEFPDGS